MDDNGDVFLQHIRHLAQNKNVSATSLFFSDIPWERQLELTGLSIKREERVRTLLGGEIHGVVKADIWPPHHAGFDRKSTADKASCHLQKCQALRSLFPEAKQEEFTKWLNH